MKKFVVAIMAAVLLTATLAGCSSSGKYKDGKYEGTGKGLKGDIKVAVEVAGGKITKIDVVEKKETDGIFDPVVSTLIPDVIKKQTTEGVNAVAGATFSSKGTIEAINKALETAKK